MGFSISSLSPVKVCQFRIRNPRSGLDGSDHRACYLDFLSKPNFIIRNLIFTALDLSTKANLYCPKHDVHDTLTVATRAPLSGFFHNAFSLCPDAQSAHSGAASLMTAGLKAQLAWNERKDAFQTRVVLH